MTLRRVCVFCGSSSGADPAFASAAGRLGALLASRGIGLVYGGGSIGLMGVLADAALRAGGHVIGVIPSALALKEVAHDGLPDLRIVATMHERKALMAELADAFVALPGGLGTLDELFETLTWAQLGIHRRPCGLLDVAGYYQPLLAFLDRAVDARFLRREHRDLLLVDADPVRLLDRLGRYSPPAETDKWIDVVRA
jgi:uncharacterized protein (TIGR00730 family)